MQSCPDSGSVCSKGSELQHIFILKTSCVIEIHSSLKVVLLCYHLFLSTEQYDTFVKFSHDQVERRLAESAFSCKFVILFFYLYILLILLIICLFFVFSCIFFINSSTVYIARFFCVYQIS